MPCFITKPVPAQLAWERASLQGYQHTRDHSERPELRPQGGSHQIRALPAVPGQRRAAGEAVQLPTARSCNKTTVTSTSPRHGQHDPVACPAPRHHRDRPTAPRRASCSSTAPDGAAAGWSSRLPPTPASCDGASPRQTAATVMGARLGGEKIARLCPQGCTWCHKAGPDLAEPWQWGEDRGVLLCIAFAHPVFTKPSLFCVLRLQSADSWHFLGG